MWDYLPPQTRCIQTSQVFKLSSSLRQVGVFGGERAVLVVEPAGLQAVEELAQHPVEQVALGLGMPVPAVAAPAVGGLGPFRVGQRAKRRQTSQLFKLSSGLRQVGVVGGDRA